MKRILIVFAKEPEKGKVKTRLSGCLSPRQCLKLYKGLLKETVVLARSAGCGQKIIAYDSGGQNPEFLKKIAGDFKFHRQKGRGLGERMFNAFKSALADQAKAVIIGSDSPGLPVSRIRRAFELLDENDLVLGPANDGGYYLIGLKKPCQKIFTGIEWSSRSVFKKTLVRAGKLKKKTAVLDFWHDIDTPQDLKYLKPGRYR